MKRWFAKSATGVNSDIKRHRDQETYLKKVIADIEAIKEFDSTDILFLNSYRGLLNILLESKASVVSNIGKKRKENK
jgi:subtilisin-like proprotein convertase family protein